MTEYVYLGCYRHTGNQAVPTDKKIGKTKDPNAREAALSRTNSSMYVQFIRVWKINGISAYECEQGIHDLLDEIRLSDFDGNSTEWFSDPHNSLERRLVSAMKYWGHQEVEFEEKNIVHTQKVDKVVILHQFWADWREFAPENGDIIPGVCRSKDGGSWSNTKFDNPYGGKIWTGNSRKANGMRTYMTFAESLQPLFLWIREQHGRLDPQIQFVETDIKERYIYIDSTDERAPLKTPQSEWQLIFKGMLERELFLRAQILPLIEEYKKNDGR